MKSRIEIDFKREFKIFKEGVTTDGKVTILSKNNEPFDRVAKIRNYLDAGFNVYDMTDKEIITI